MRIQIADIQLPEKSVENILSILESNNLPARVPAGGGSEFNCWGFTAYYCHWIQRAYWMDGTRMEDLLKDNTEPIKESKVKAGDVAVFRRGKFLAHTAIVLPTEKGTMVCHKPGSTPLCIDTVESVSSSYGTVTYARVVKESDETI
jgi:hypothetical protein